MSLSIPKLRTALFNAIFSSEEVAFHEELYKRDPPTVTGGVDVDPEIIELLEELAFDDLANAKELTDYKSEMGKDALRRLQTRRRHQRAELFSFSM